MAWYHAKEQERQMLIDAGQCVRCCRRRDWIGELGKYKATAEYCSHCNKCLLQRAQQNRDIKNMFQAAGKCIRCFEPRGKTGNDKHCRACLIQITYKRKKAALKKTSNTEE